MAGPRRRRDLWIGLGLGLAVLVALLATESSIGFVRDEGYYFRAAEDYQGWFAHLVDSWADGEFARPFGADSVKRHWHYNTEHPVAVKLTQSFTWWLFHRTLGLVSNAAGFRLGSMLFAVLLALGTYLLGTRLYGRRVGLLGVLLLFSMPHVFFHAHLACFDVPITAMTVLVAYAFWRARTEARWGWRCGLLFGLALCTKLNAFFLIPVLALFWLLESWRGFSVRRDGGGPRLHLPAVPLAFLWMLLLGPLMFMLHWPWLWHDTAARLTWYLNFHWNHVHYPVEYFGRILDEPPFPIAFPFVMSALTVPAMTFCLGALGFFWALARQRPLALAVELLRWIRTRVLRMPDRTPAAAAGRDPAALYLALHAFVPFAIIAGPNVPIFGGVKHWLPAMPFLALLAAFALDRLLDAVEELLGKKLEQRLRIYALCGGLALVPALVGTGGYLANGSGFFNELAGGPEGGARLGMMRQFWGYAARQGLPWLNQHAEKDARVNFHNANFDSYRVYKRDGLVREDLAFAGEFRQADYFLFHNQGPKLLDEYHVRSYYGSGKPVYGVYLDEAPILVIYERDPKAGQDVPRRKLERREQNAEAAEAVEEPAPGLPGSGELR